MALVQPYQNVAAVAFQFWAKPVLQAQDGSYYCPGFEGATYAKNEWDKLIISVPYNPPLEEPSTPGLCEISVTKERTYDKKKAAGSDGARVTVHGIDPAQVEVRVTVWTPEQLRRLKSLWDVLFPGPQKQTKVIKRQIQIEVPAALAANVVAPLLPESTQSTVTSTKKITQIATPTVPYDVQHPLLDMHKITALLFVSGSGPEPGRVVGSKTFVMRSVEFFKPQRASATGTPNAAVASIGSQLDPGAYPTPGTVGGNTNP